MEKPYRVRLMTEPKKLTRISLVGLVWMLRILGTVPAQAETATEVVLHDFAPATGAYPVVGVIRDSAGNLYGTTTVGGTAGQGVVYKLDAAGQYSVLYNFTGGADRGQPYAGVIRDSSGNLYGTTSGGTANAGVVYKVDIAGKETVLYSFTGGADGGNPYSGVILDSSGKLYGTTYDGGTGKVGVVYKVDMSGQETVLCSFNGYDGALPFSGVVRDPVGNLYGTTAGGGGPFGDGQGVVYKQNPSGHITVLYAFPGGAAGGETSRV